MNIFGKTLVASAMLLAASTSTYAATIVGLFNTGTDASNLALAGGNGVIDPHYTIVASTSGAFIGQQAQTYFNGAYVANDANSRWISMNGSGGVGSSSTTYRLTFDLTGLIPMTASISGLYGADNEVSIFLNGANTGFFLGGGANPANFTGLTAFNLTSGFVSGINTLDFRVVDLGAPTALRVDNLAGTADLIVTGGVPEPGTWAMMLAGIGLMGGALRARRRDAVRVRFG